MRIVQNMRTKWFYLVHTDDEKLIGSSAISHKPHYLTSFVSKNRRKDVLKLEYSNNSYCIKRKAVIKGKWKEG